MAHANTPFKPANPGWHRVAITRISESTDRFPPEEGEAKRYEFLLSFSDPNAAGTATMLFWVKATFATRTDKSPSNFSRLLSAADPKHEAHDPITGDWNEKAVPDVSLGLGTLYGRECNAEVIQEPRKDDPKKMKSLFTDFRPCSQAAPPAKPPFTKKMAFITGDRKSMQSAPVTNPEAAELRDKITRARSEARQMALARKEGAD